MSGILPLNTSNNDSTNYNQVNRLITEFQNEQVTKIFKDDTGTRRVLMGKGKDGFYGFKVSEDGVDVYEAANDELIFNSSQNVFKIVATGTIEVSAYTLAAGETNTYSGGTQAFDVHGLGYSPAVIAYIYENDVPSIHNLMPLTRMNGGGTGGGYSMTDFRIYTDTQQVRVVASTWAYGGYNFSGITINAHTVKYYLLQESAV